MVWPSGTAVGGRSEQRAQGREGPRPVADGALLGLRHLAEGAPVALDGHHQRVVSEADVAAGRVSDLALDHAAHDVLAAARSSDGCRSEEHTSELQALMRSSYAVFCLKIKQL